MLPQKRVSLSVFIFLILISFTAEQKSWAKKAPAPQVSEEEAEGPGFNALFMLGPSTYIIGPADTELVYEFSLAYRLSNKFETGVEYGKAGKTHIFGVDLNYFFAPEIFVGFQTGFKTDDHDYFYFGPQAGYDFFLHQHFTIGAEVQFLGSIQDQSAIFEVLATTKYHF